MLYRPHWADLLGRCLLSGLYQDLSGAPEYRGLPYDGCSLLT